MVLTGGILIAIFLCLSTIDVGFNKVYHIIFIIPLSKNSKNTPTSISGGSSQVIHGKYGII